ncbi:S8 family serine peptidase [Candidatus Berkelbacteria bacterium]|nr:S8 family serine peptidase [Candidatus Berkelbacteria bacterium]
MFIIGVRNKIVWILAGLVILGGAGGFGYLTQTGKIKLSAEGLLSSAKRNQPPKVETPSPKKIKFVSGEAIVKFKESPKTKKLETQFSELKSSIKRPDDQFEPLLPKANLSDSGGENLSKFVKVKLKLQTKDQKEPEFPKGFPEELKPPYNFEEQETLSLIAAYKQNPTVESAEPNILYEPNFIPNDPYFNSGYTWGQNYDDLWGTKVIQSSLAWDSSQGEGITVAVVDTGIDYNHEDIRDNVWQNSGEVAGDGVDNDQNGYIDDTRGWNFYDNNNNPMDTYGHGTHVAGTIAATGNNELGIVGVAFKSKVMALKVGDQFGFPFSAIFGGIYYAVSQGAKVINMSYGGYGPYSPEDELLDYADSKNVVLVASAGNNWAEARLYGPAGHPKVITVGALDPYGQKPWWSNYGLKLDVMAPGVDTLSLRSAVNNLPTDRIVGGKYIRLDGTSMAAPHVSGAAAILLAKNPNFLPSQIKYSLKKTSDDLGSQGIDLEFGYGRINLAQSLSVVNPPIINLAFYNPDFNQNVRGQLSFSGRAFSNRLANYKIEYTTVNRPYSWNTILEDSQLPENDFLGNWDTTKVFDEKYWLKLTVTTAGNQPYLESIYTLVFPINKVKEGWPKISNSEINSAVTLADLDQDAKKEVLVNSNKGFMGGQTAANVFRGDGSYFPGWPKEHNRLFDSLSSASAVADLDRNGSPDIIYSSELRSDQVYARRSDGTNLPGWPVSIRLPTSMTFIKWAAPTVFDIDRDGYPEVIIGDLNGYLNVFNHAGRPVAGWPQKVSDYQDAYITSTAAVGDIDQDGQVEIIVSMNNYGANFDLVAVYTANGQAKPGWPKKVFYNTTYLPWDSSSPVLSDLNGDGKLEIIVKLRKETDWRDGYYPARLAVFDYQGNMLPGWPQPIGGSYFTSPLVADLDNDGKLEIATVGDLYQWDNGWISATSIRVFRPDGSQIWEKLLSKIFYPGKASPIAVNIDGDAQKEILVPTFGWYNTGDSWNFFLASGQIYAFKADGAILSKDKGWPKMLGGANWASTPAAADIDGDGKLELVSGSENGVFAWDLKGVTTNQTNTWPMFQHDQQHTGFLRTFFSVPPKKDERQKWPPPLIWPFQRRS